MGAPKNHAKAGGRKAGVPNRVTTNAREAIAAFVEGNTERLNRLLDAIENGIPKDDGDGFIAYPNPKAAFDAIMSVAEYHLPKLARSEVKADLNATIEHKISATDQDIINRYLDKSGK